MLAVGGRKPIRVGDSVYASFSCDLGRHVETSWIICGKLARRWSPPCKPSFWRRRAAFQIPFLFKTPDSWNLMVRGPTNSPQDGIVALDGIIETDWAHSTFTMTWRFTRACTVEFALKEPICVFFPIQRGVLEMFRGEFRMLEADREF
jgi:uncharacterized protein DUF6065